MHFKQISLEKFNYLKEELPWVRTTKIRNSSYNYPGEGCFMKTDSSGLGLVEIKNVSGDTVEHCDSLGFVIPQYPDHLEWEDFKGLLEQNKSWLPSCLISFCPGFSNAIFQDKDMRVSRVCLREWDFFGKKECFRSFLVEQDVTEEVVYKFFDRISKLSLAPAIFCYSPDKGLYLP